MYAFGMVLFRTWSIAAAMAGLLLACDSDPSPPAITTGTDTFTIEQDQPLVVGAPGLLANDTSPRALALYVMADQAPAHGALDLSRNDGSFSFTPEPGVVGVDTFTYLATDLQLTSDPTAVTITVT